MKAISILFTVLFVGLVSLIFPTLVSADGIIIPDPGQCYPPPCPGPRPMEQLEIRYHHVEVTIKDQLAVTRVDQVFYNPNEWPIEGMYVFPIPVDAVMTNFVIWVDGKPVQGQVLEAEEARQMYQEIVNQMRDPALLEYVGRGAMQASIYPIPPMGEQRIELEYTEVLAAENGLVSYVYPLSTEKFSTKPLESVIVNVEIASGSPIRAVYSPSHEVAITRENDRQVKVGYEASNVLPDTDFTLYYSLGESEAFHVLSYRDPTDAVDADGFFLIMLAPRIGTITRVIPKDLILVLDQSGSMDGKKFRQAQEALRYILEHLNSEDRFNIISFSTGTRSYANSLRPASEANEARGWVNSLSAQGSTDINRALLEAASLVDSSAGIETGRPAYVIFLTDGLPTEGEVDSQKILDNFRNAVGDDLRLFAFGVGYDVDTFLLDSLAQENRGASFYVLPDESLDEKLSTFYTKISTPVLTDLKLDFSDLAVYDLYPSPLPDLFVGSQIIVVGRYKEGGEVDVKLTGEFDNEILTFEYPRQVFDQESHPNSQGAVIPRIWATRKVGYLLNQIRLNGADEETIGQIVKLSIRYGIVTPYTSYLVTEEMALGADAQERITGEQFNQLLEASAAPVAGEGAVQKAADQGALAGAESAYAPPAETVNQVKIVGARTFVWADEVWVDTRFAPDIMETVKVTFLSAEYYSLIEAREELAAAFALGGRVIAMSEGTAYEVVAADAQIEQSEQVPSNPDTPAEKTAPTSTSVPDEPVPTETTPEIQPTEEPSPGNWLCGAGFLPLLLIPAALVLTFRQKSN